MNHYIDIHILPDPDFTTPSLMGALFNKLHRALVVYQSDCIALSFPAISYKTSKKDSKVDGPLGRVLRLHGKQENLANLMESNWLKGINDHIEKTTILPVPKEHSFITLRRKQCISKSKVARMRTRRMRRENETLEQAMVAIPDSTETKLKQPFIQVRSASTGQSFKLFIEQLATKETELVSHCNCYGVAKAGVLPLFRGEFLPA